MRSLRRMVLKWSLQQLTFFLQGEIIKRIFVSSLPIQLAKSAREREFVVTAMGTRYHGCNICPRVPKKSEMTK